MIVDNEVLPELEKLGRHEFDLDIEEQVRLTTEGEAEVERVRCFLPLFAVLPDVRIFPEVWIFEILEILTFVKKKKKIYFFLFFLLILCSNTFSGFKKKYVFILVLD